MKYNFDSLIYDSPYFTGHFKSFIALKLCTFRLAFTWRHFARFRSLRSLARL